MRRVTIAVAIVVIVGGLIVLGLTTDFLVDWAWFSAIGYLQVYWTRLISKTFLFLVTFVSSAALLGLNGLAAYRFSRAWRERGWVDLGDSFGRVQTLPEVWELTRRRLPWPLLITGAAVAIGLLVAAGEVSYWEEFLRFLYQVPYGQNDPLYGKDLSFYLFSLPAYLAFKNWLWLMLFFSLIIAVALYWVHGDIQLEEQRWSVSPAAVAHGSVLLSLFFAVKAWSYGLERFLLMYRDNGVVVGASYTDVHVERLVLWLLVGLAAAASLALLANVRVRTYKIPVLSLAVVFGVSLVFGQVFPALFQRLFVKPNELQLEKPYLRHNIALTQQAYNLHQVTIQPFPAEQSLTWEMLQGNRATVDNIRLWDWQPLMDTYGQLQEIRTYYKFHDVDVDRYVLDGTYHQVMLSARELKQALLPPNAQTWVNRHVLFTHGNGVVMSPVTRKNPEGLPVFYLQDIPTVSTGGPPLQEGRIYYGEETDGYVIVKATTPEFDYPKGKDNVYAMYDGNGGVPVGGIAQRALFAWYFKDLNLLFTGYIAGDSRLMMRRTIREQVQMIAPFLRLDRDPYLVVSQGRLFWIQDAYTTSTYFPYSQALRELGLNYIRNAVKVVIDAYQGTAQLYVVDPADPVAATYQRIFPGLLQPFEAMPQDLQRHIRYPENLFVIQAQLYRTYHMESPEVFYNREDLWQFPRQQSGGETATMAPYYTIMRLPGESQAEFVLMLPMVPSQRQNMIAWLTARCDPPHYGQLLAYEVPKDKLVYGPFQIEARINQNPEISQQISLWNQMGSRVIHGNLLVIPIENSLLYVSPLYLRAESGQLPELKRVITAYGDRVTMEDTLAGALAALFKDSAPIPQSPAARAAPPAAGVDAARAREALERYDQAMERLKAGDWGGFGGDLGALRKILEELAH
jgi:uncharacterized membrane protein (UPF0182 family)